MRAYAAKQKLNSSKKLHSSALLIPDTVARHLDMARQRDGGNGDLAEVIANSCIEVQP